MKLRLLLYRKISAQSVSSLSQLSPEYLSEKEIIYYKYLFGLLIWGLSASTNSKKFLKISWYTHYIASLVYILHVPNLRLV